MWTLALIACGPAEPPPPPPPTRPSSVPVEARHLHIDEGEVTITIFSKINGGPTTSENIRHELLHYAIWKLIGVADPGHESPLWKKCSLKHSS